MENPNFSSLIINWYHQNKRDLPWRNSSDPYEIWVSEIMLQQTRVDQAIPFYLRFLERFPSVDRLAEASEQEVLKFWQGLGYYSRARNMHATAKQLMEVYGGNFPQEISELEGLKGIGKYTAAAIASISFNKPFPVVDGNVSRVLSRVFGVNMPVNTSPGEKEIRRIALELMDSNRPAAFNQAMMEFGARFCTPSLPDCPRCIFSDSCKAYLEHRVELLPMKQAKAPSRVRIFNYLIIKYISDNIPQVYLHKRETADIWKNLYDFPLVETSTEIGYEELVREDGFRRLLKGNDYVMKRVAIRQKHILTHQVIHAFFWEIQLEVPLKEPGGPSCFAVTVSNIGEFPVPRLIDRYLKSYL